MDNFEAMPPMWSVPKTSRKNEPFGERNQYVCFGGGAGMADIQHCTRLINSTGYVATQLDRLIKLWETKRRNASKALEDELLQLTRLKDLTRLQQAELARDTSNTAESWREKTDKLHSLLMESMNREKELLNKVEELRTLNASQKATEQVREQLERVDSFLHFVLRNAPLAIGHQSFEDKAYRQRFVYNQYPAFNAEIFGKTSDELLGVRNISRSIRIEDLATELKKPFSREIMYTSPDPCFGDKTFIAYVEPVLDHSEEVEGIHILAMDITDQVAKWEKLAKLREEAAVQRAIQNELCKTLGITEETTRAKQLLATMSHEIRSPLSGVMGMLDVLATTKLDSEQQKLVEIMTTSGEVVLQVINDILDLSKYESETLKLEEKSFNLRDLVKSVLQVASASAKNKKLSLEGYVAEDVPHEIIGDWLRIRQLLVNLISNAIKFTDKGHVTLQVTARHEAKQEALPDENGQQQHPAVWLNFEVSDTGIGIPESDFPYLFNMYMQNTYARENGRTGLGLAICKKLVERMGGELKVSSIVNKGSSFTFRIPVKRTHSKLKKQARFHFAPCETLKETKRDGAGSLEEYLRLKQPRILMVDDSSVNVTVTQNMLKRLGAKADVVMTGKDGVDAATRKKYDLILMDICLPVLDGPEATRQIREHERKFSQKKTPILAMTANSEQAYRDMDGCITKPFKLDKLKQTLESIFLPE